MAKEIYIPKLGQTMEEVTFLNWLVKDGDTIEKGQAILDVETDKAVFPVESNAAGIVHLGPFQAGQVIPVLTVIAVVGTSDDKFNASQPGKPSPVETTLPETEPATVIPADVVATGQAFSTSPENIFISPRAKKMAVQNHTDWSKIPASGNEGKRIIERDVFKFLTSQPKITPVAEKIAGESGLDLTRIQGSGPHGRIMKTDVLHAVETAPLATSADEVNKTIPLSGIRGVIASRMAESSQSTARVTLFMEADATRFVELREMLKVKFAAEWGFAPGYNDLLARICSSALQEFPYMNARINGSQIEWLSAIHMGMAVDTERGLVVPVIAYANLKSLRQFGSEFRSLVGKAQTGTLLPDEMNGGTFTITNLGGQDVLAFTPVINLPQAAILGVGKISPALAMKDGKVVEYQKLILSLVFDHRIVDGAPAARFLQWIKDRIEYPELLGFN
jgi:pyruvate dehydrogenase E2 component (dihydrolipoamide acetyltransferase)